MATSRTFSISAGPWFRSLVCGSVFTVVLLVLMAGCGAEGPEQAQSHLLGRITTEGGSDFEGFQVLVVDVEGRSIDTLGRAVTASDGEFSLTVTAPERGVYPLMIWGRDGITRLASTDYVVVDGDSGTLRVDFPLEDRALQVRSDENTALRAYRNTIAQHRRTLVERLRAEAVDSNAISQGVRQTSSMLWSLQKTFPETYASQLGAAESLSLLAGWDDSLVVARAREVTPSSPRYVEVAQIAHRAAARLHGQSAALDLLDTFAAKAQDPAQHAGIQAVRIRMFIDSVEVDAALSAAHRLRNEYPDTKWADWAERVQYEINNLRRGMRAPDFEARTVDGDSISLLGFAGHPVVLEYFRPGSSLYQQQLATRNVMYERTRSDSVAFVSVCVSPDTLVYRAFAQEQSLPGAKVIAPKGMDDPLVAAYNIADVPARVLIDATGRIVGRYPGSAFFAFQEDLARLLRAPE